MTAQSPREVELKFDLDPNDTARLRATLATRLGADAETSRLVSTYFDTTDHHLQAAGVTLRVRSDADGALVQTVKRSRGPTSALFDRDEWETALETGEPDLDAFAATPAGEPLADRALKLEPVFETVVERSVWQVARAGSRIEVALDEGRVTAGLRTEALAELELELKHGPPHHLFALVRELGDIGSLRPGVLTKSERGYRLVRNKPHRASKADRLRLDKHMTAGEAFGAIVHACLRHFGLNAPLVVERSLPEALHQARVALRRLRSALSLFKQVVADEAYAELKAELQELSQVLGQARNLDVYLSDQVENGQPRPDDEPGREPFLAEIERRRRAAYEDVIARLKSPAFGALLLRLVEWTEAGTWRTGTEPDAAKARDRAVRRVAARLLQKRHRRVLRRGRHLAALDPHARHRVRIEAKKLRYASEFFAGLARRPKIIRRHEHFVAALEELQEALGALNDIQTGHDIAVSFIGEARSQGGTAAEELFAASLVSGRQEAQAETLLRTAEATHARLAGTKRFWAGWFD